MNSETANRINSAICRIYFFRRGLVEKLSNEEIRIIQQSNLGQIQTATEVIEAENRDRPFIAGKRSIRVTVDSAVIPYLIIYAQSLPALPGTARTLRLQ